MVTPGNKVTSLKVGMRKSEHFFFFLSRNPRGGNSPFNRIGRGFERERRSVN